MVGRSLTAPAQRCEEPAASAAKQVLLSVKELRSLRPPELRGVSFELGRGEILGVSGLMGSGASELVGALYGLREFQGRVELSGELYRPRQPRDALSRGVAFLAADRRDSVIPELSVEHNATLSSLPRRGRFGVPDRRAEREVVSRGVAELGIKAASPRVRAGSLSGGNQQKLALLRCLLTEPRLLLLDDPTRGVDVAAKAELHARIRELSTQGLAVLLFSSEPDELLALCDRVLAFFGGRVSREFRRPELEREALQRALMGAEA
jgi:ribose transport system ATP-binding protein